MAKLIGILAASLGGGLILGAGIRLGERLAGEASGEGAGAAAGLLSSRLGELEGRLSNLEAVRVEAAGVTPADVRIDLSGIESRLAAQAGEVSAVRVRLDEGASRMETLGQTDERLRSELLGWVDQRVDERLRGVESRLRAESDEAQREMLNAVVESVQTRVIQRISKLEEEVAGQSEGMVELRECTLRTEQSMQKLLGGIDRLILAQPQRDSQAAPPAAARPEPAPLPELPPLPAEPVLPKAPAAAVKPPEAPESASQAVPPTPRPTPVMPSLTQPRRRWSIFG